MSGKVQGARGNEPLFRRSVEEAVCLRILFITTGLNLGGAERTLQRLAVELNRRGHCIKICSLRAGGRIAEELRSRSINVLEIGFRKSLGDFWRWLQLGRSIRQFQPDIVQTWMYHADLAGGLMARCCVGAPTVWGIRQSNLDAQRSKRLTRWVVATNARLSRWVPSCVVYCATAAARVHRKVGYAPRNEQVIQNGCETAVFKRSVDDRQALRQQLEVAEGAPIIGHAGRWDAQKDYPSLVNAMGQISTVFPEATFVLVGTGIDEGNRELVCLIQEAGLKRVRLFGISNDMVAFYSALDCFIMSSAYGEGFPNVLTEAMACEVPCVATDVGDSGSIVGNTGRVVPVRSPDDLARAVLSILQMTPAARCALGVMACDRIVEHFSFERMVDQYEQLYTGLVKQG